MRYRLISKILGIGLVLFSLFQLLPIIVSIIYNENSERVFIDSFLITFFSGLFLTSVNYTKEYQDLKIRDGFLLTVLLWFVFSIFASIPLYLSKATDLSIVNAYFESVSGLTTTGASVLNNLEGQLKSILFYRSLLQWIGGLGIIVLALALFPLLGIGGMQLYRGEGKGSINSTKLRPKMAETGKSLWYIYLILTMSCFVCYFFSGMGAFDAITHSFSTVAIGGFSNYEASFGHFDNNYLYFFGSVFMFLSGISFSLHFIALKKKTFKNYLSDPELKFYASTAFVAFLFVFITLIATTGKNDLDLLLRSLFQTISFITTTGFTSEDHSLMPLYIPYILIGLAAMGACAGSTGGGIKVIRVLIFFKQGFKELKKLVHPNSVMPLKVGSKIIDKEITDSVWGFLSVYVMTMLLGIVLLLGTGLSIDTAFSAVFSCLNNLGPALGDATLNYSSLNDVSKLFLSFAMILGRLEIYTLLVLFTSFFWRN
jgi:trk system potassium uptake protein TrkH